MVFGARRIAPVDPVFVFEGSIMPTTGGGSTVWYLENAIVGPPTHPLPAR